MPFDQIQGQGHGGLKCAKMADFKAISSANMHAIKRLTVIYHTPRQCINFNLTDLWYSSSFGVTWPSNLGCSTFEAALLHIVLTWLSHLRDWLMRHPKFWTFKTSSRSNTTPENTTPTPEQSELHVYLFYIGTIERSLMAAGICDPMQFPSDTVHAECYRRPTADLYALTCSQYNTMLGLCIDRRVLTDWCIRGKKWSYRYTYALAFVPSDCSCDESTVWEKKITLIVISF